MKVEDSTAQSLRDMVPQIMNPSRLLAVSWARAGSQVCLVSLHHWQIVITNQDSVIKSGGDRHSPLRSWHTASGSVQSFPSPPLKPSALAVTI